MLRRITIDSTRVSVAVTPFARSVKEVGLIGKSRAGTPIHLSFPGQVEWGPQLRGLIERYELCFMSSPHRQFFVE